MGIARDHQCSEQLRGSHHDGIDRGTRARPAAKLRCATGQWFVQRMNQGQPHRAVHQHIAHPVAGQRVDEHSSGHDRWPQTALLERRDASGRLPVPTAQRGDGTGVEDQTHVC